MRIVICKASTVGGAADGADADLYLYILKIPHVQQRTHEAAGQIKNNFDGVIAFDEEGIPLSRCNGHSFGTRSIVTFCNKYNAFYAFGMEDEAFDFRLIFH